MARCALITGITGQDGYYLAVLLLQKGYMVHGIYRPSVRSWRPELEQLRRVYPNHCILHAGDITDFSTVLRYMSAIEPDECYHLAAQSDVAVSFTMPVYTVQATGIGLIHLLEAVRTVGGAGHIRIYQASSSELFGKAQEIPQTERTPFYPRSPYASAKLYAYWIAINYREAYGMFVSNGILFNHESPLRGESFVTQKIVRGIVRYKSEGVPLHLGNLTAERDWGYAPEYVEAMWRMLQYSQSDDFVIATGRSISVRRFVELVCTYAGIPLAWHTKDRNRIYGIDTATGALVVCSDELYMRPNEVEILCGNADKAERLLQWKAQTTVEEIAHIMFDAASHAKYSISQKMGNAHEQAVVV